MTDKPDLDAIEARREKAMDVIRKLCNGTRDWIMRIPAGPDYDPDLVIGAALKDNRDLTAALREAWEENERLTGQKPTDWYCGRCSEVVPLRERCRICGATKRESGVA